MNRVLIATALLAGSAPAFAQSAPQTVDRGIMHVQVILDRLGFSPGVIDGREGESLKLALRGFQTSRGLKPSGTIDQATLRALHPYRQVRPTVAVKLGAEDLSGPFINPIPEEAADQARLPCMCYRTALERIAERFHTTPETLIAMNGADTALKVGQMIQVPGALPQSRDYAIENPKARELLSALNVDAKLPQGDRVEVDKSDGVLRVFAGKKLIAQFPATMGSKRDPLPIGTWKILGHSYAPTWHYQPAILKKADKNDKDEEIKAGPNNPVGVAWLDLSKEHYGIHGTAEPATVGRAESNGCIRLTNWDVMRLSQMVKPGTQAVFQE